VVHLVLQADGPEPIEVDFEGFSVHVLRARADRSRSFHFIENAWHLTGSPSSVIPTPSWDSSSGLQNTWGWFFPSETSITINRLCTSTWVAASPYPGREIHGLEHVFDQLRQGSVKHLDRLGLGAKSGVRVFKNMQARHDVPLDCC
jgi:hypothetical protein